MKPLTTTCPVYFVLYNLMTPGQKLTRVRPRGTWHINDPESFSNWPRNGSNWRRVRVKIYFCFNTLLVTLTHISWSVPQKWVNPPIGLVIRVNSDPVCFLESSQSKPYQSLSVRTPPPRESVPEPPPKVLVEAAVNKRVQSDVGVPHPHAKKPHLFRNILWFLLRKK